MRLRPRSPTLFPYTTLFRSGAFYEAFEPTRARELVRRIEFCYTPKHGRTQCGALTDRKSTRLNSSHRCISYAVFCLKKKNYANSCSDAFSPNCPTTQDTSSY